MQANERTDERVAKYLSGASEQASWCLLLLLLLLLMLLLLLLLLL